MSCFRILICSNLVKTNLLVTVAALFTFIFGIYENSTAQNRLDRISVTERSDGRGFVVRFHLTESVDSFAIAHIEQQRMQLAIFNDEIVINESLILPDFDVINNLKIIRSEGLLVFDISLYDEQKFTGSSYFDVNQTDILLALTYTNERLVKANRPFIDSVDDIEDATEESKSFKSSTDDSKKESEIKEVERFISDSNKSKKIRLQRVFPGDLMEFYLRWVGEESGYSDENHHLRYSGYSGATEYRAMEFDHPWSRHPFFSDVDEHFYSDLIFFDPVFFTSYNSGYPVGGNDGALWQGKGFNNTFTMGVGYKHDFLELVLRPVYLYSENRDFTLSPTPPYNGLSKYAMALTYSDIPQRFGDSSIKRLDFGDSFLKLKYKGWAAGLSNERIRTGPAIYNPLLFGYNAPGFFHTFVGTDKPLSFLKGRIDFRLFWGNLRGSDYLYPEDVDVNLPDTRIITGYSINYSPGFVSGMHLGFTRTSVSYLPDSGLQVGDLFMAFRRSQKKDNDMDPFDARLSKMALFIRWHFPKSGFEAYTEWGRYDNRRLLRDVLLEPELNRAYVLGFLKRFNVGSGRRIVLNGEITNLENIAVTAQSRDFNIWYTHPVIKHGFTHRGQVLGAPIGPGSSTQKLNVSYYDRFGMVGFSLGRIAFHNDRFFKNLDFFKDARARPWIPLYFYHEVEMFGTLHAVVFTPGDFELQADIRYGIIENRNNQYDVDTTGPVLQRFYFDESNWNVAITLRYLLPSQNR